VKVDFSEYFWMFFSALSGYFYATITHSFVALETTIELMKEIKEDTLIITESGILSANDVAFMHKHHIYSFLVGEAFMRHDNPGKALPGSCAKHD
jgi:indole-3-glycerol phosphate synthase